MSLETIWQVPYIDTLVYFNQINKIRLVKFLSFKIFLVFNEIIFATGFEYLKADKRKEK